MCSPACWSWERLTSGMACRPARVVQDGEEAVVQAFGSVRGTCPETVQALADICHHV